MSPDPDPRDLDDRRPRPSGVPKRPPLPIVERLDRNALTIVAVILGVLVLAAVIFVQPTRQTTPPQPNATPEPAPPTFLDRPPRAPATSAPSLTDTGAAAHRADSTLMLPPAAPIPTERPARGTWPAIAANPDADARAALDAPLIAADNQSTRAPSVAEVTSAPPDSLVTSGPMTPFDSGSLVLRRPNMPTDVTDREHLAPVVHTSVLPAPGPYALQAGTVLPATLITEIDSDLPGDVLAQIARDVWDSEGEQHILIPKGSKLLGSYANRVTVGQDRLLVSWHRLIFPDGRSITLPALETKDVAGAAGVHDQVDRHTAAVFGTTALLSLISAGVQLSQPRGTYTPFGYAPSTGEIAAGAVGQQLAQAATEMLRRNLDVAPTIRIRPGTAFGVFLRTDLTFPGPYLAHR